MGSVLLQEETGVPGENVWCLVESNWTTLFSHVTKITAWSRNRTLVTVVRDTCTTTVPLAPLRSCVWVLTALWLKHFTNNQMVKTSIPVIGVELVKDIKLSRTSSIPRLTRGSIFLNFNGNKGFSELLYCRIPEYLWYIVAREYLNLHQWPFHRFRLLGSSWVSYCKSWSHLSP